MKRRRSREDIVVDSVNYTLLAILSIVMLYPFYYVLIASFNLGSDTARGGLYIVPRAFTWNNYAFFFKDPNWTNAFWITIYRTVLGTALSIVFTCLVAYGLSKPYLVFRKIYFLIIIIAMNVSGGLVAYYVVLRSIGLLNIFAVYVIPTMLNLFFLLIAVSFFREIPEELAESARMDGASETSIFARIIMPISLPLVATMSLFIGSGQWNSWLDSAYFVQGQSLRTLSYRMIEVMNQTLVSSDTAAAQFMTNLQLTQFSIQATAMIISVLPIICVYPFIQKYFVQGMMLGSVKG